MLPVRPVWEDGSSKAGLLSGCGLQAAQLLRTNPPALRRLQQEHQYLQVDEFQDSNPVQARAPW